MLFLPADLPPPTVDPDGIEIEADMPAALHPLAVEFKTIPIHHFGVWEVRMYRRPSHTPPQGHAACPRGVARDVAPYVDGTTRRATRNMGTIPDPVIHSCCLRRWDPPPALSAASGEGTSTPDNAHNPKSTPWPLFNAAVAKPVTRKELHDTPAAMQALVEEAEQLQAWKHMGFEQRKIMVICSSGSETRRQ